MRKQFPHRLRMGAGRAAWRSRWLAVLALVCCAGLWSGPVAAAITLAEEFHRRFAARTELYRDDDAGDIAARAGVSVGLRGQRLGGRGISVFALAGTAAALLLSAGITAFSLFGGDLLTSIFG